MTAVLSFCSSVTCIADSNDGQRSGPPQPIGIDFGLSEVYQSYPIPKSACKPDL